MLNRHHWSAFGVFWLLMMAVYACLITAPALGNPPLIAGITTVVCLNGLWLLCAFSVPPPPSTLYRYIPLVLAISTLGLCSFIDPIAEDDYLRYLWDGYLCSEGYNPYLSVPSDFFNQSLSEPVEIILNGVSNPDTPTVYGAAAQAIFTLCHWISPGSLWPLKGLIFMVNGLLLLSLHSRVSPRLFVLFAFCPILLHSFAINIHIDIFAIYLALHACLSKNKIASAVLLGLAFSIKPFAILLLPFLALHHAQSPRYSTEKMTYSFALYCISMLAAYILIELPFILSGANALSGIAQASTIWAFNNPLFYLLSDMLSGSLARTIMLLGFVCSYTFLLIQFWSKQSHSYHSNRITHTAPYIFLALLVFSPTVNAWYLSWLLVFAVFSPRLIWPWLAAMSVWLSYCTGYFLGVDQYALYQIPTWLMWLEWLVPLLAFIPLLLENRNKAWPQKPQLHTPTIGN